MGGVGGGEGEGLSSNIHLPSKPSNLPVEGYSYFVEQDDFLHTTQVCNICITLT